MGSGLGGLKPRFWGGMLRSRRSTESRARSARTLMVLMMSSRRDWLCESFLFFYSFFFSFCMLDRESNEERYILRGGS